MTEKYHSLTVVLDQDLREYDALAIISTILQLRGVLQVTGQTVAPATYMAEQRAKHQLRMKILELLPSESPSSSSTSAGQQRSKKNRRSTRHC